MAKKDKNIKNVDSKKIFSDTQKEEILNEIYTGVITVDSLSPELFEQTKNYLMKALEKGYGNIEVDYESKDFEMLKSLKENIYRFSGAKDFTQVEEMSKMLIDEDGKNRTLKEFKEVVNQTFTNYNQDFLASEYNATQASARNASKWVTYQENKELYSSVQFVCAEDELLCDECADFDGLIADKDDADFPGLPIHFNCRCTTIETDAEPTPKDENDGVVEDELFQQNSGKTGEIFDSSHPYFQIPESQFEAAKENWGLGLPKEE